MSVILAFRPRREKPETKPPFRVAGKVVIFTGVRYERIPDASITIVKTAKKTRKTA
jgi:hypothetical protein